MDNTTTSRTNDAATLFAKVFGVIYLLVGLAGFFVTGFDGWLETDTDDMLLWFEVNPLHNVVHLLIGAALLAGSARPRSARTIAAIVGTAYALVGIIGFWALGESWNILSLNMADNWLHIGTAIIALLAIGASSRRTHDTTTVR